tara:strand:+ start:122 stop:286 length:165 start_codon:yes stop_codon:yes gene_type:complete
MAGAGTADLQHSVTAIATFAAEGTETAFATIASVAAASTFAAEATGAGPSGIDL